MQCPTCRSMAVKERSERTVQGYRRFRLRRLWQAVQRAERWPAQPGTISERRDRSRGALAVRYKLCLRDLAEMFLTRGFVVTYEAVRDWEAKLTPALAEELRRRRKGKVGRSWYVDETYIRVRGRWRYLYRAIDRDGSLVDVMLSDHRDLAAAEAFFRWAKAVTDVTPDRVTTNGHDTYPRAIRTELGKRVRHRTSRARCSQISGRP